MSDEFRCFVGGLAWATTDDDLRNAFTKFGDVTDSKIINDRETGRSRGFGFVTFGDEKSMNDAFEASSEALFIDNNSVRPRTCKASSEALFINNNSVSPRRYVQPVSKELPAKRQIIRSLYDVRETIYAKNWKGEIIEVKTITDKRTKNMNGDKDLRRQNKIEEQEILEVRIGKYPPCKKLKHDHSEPRDQEKVKSTV